MATPTADSYSVASGATVVAGRSNVLQLTDNYERSSIVLSQSSVTGDGDSAVVLAKPLATISQSGAGWIEFGFKITGALGKRPTFRIPYVNSYFGAWETYAPNRRGMFSYDDGKTWTYFDTGSVDTTNGWIVMRHNTAFTSDTVLISRSRQLSVHNCGDWIATLLSTYPSLVGPSPTAVTYSPGPNLSGFSAQSCIANEYSQQTQLYYLTSTSTTFTGRTIPPTPLYGVSISDSSLSPPVGSKELVVIVGGVHAGEDLGDFLMQKFVEHLLGSSTEAQYLRQYFNFLLYPCANAPGRAGGHFRTQYQKGTGGVNDDINRNFNTSSAGFETNDFMRALVDADRAGVVPKVYLDFHGTYLSNGFNIVEDAGVTLHATYRSRLATACGFSWGDDANTPAGAVSAYFRDLGTAFYMTHEMGDQTTQADSKYVTAGQAIVQVLASMKADALI